MLPLPDQDLPLAPRTRRLVQRIAIIVAVACFLGLLATKAGGAASPPRSLPPEFSVSQATEGEAEYAADPGNGVWIEQRRPESVAAKVYGVGDPQVEAAAGGYPTIAQNFPRHS